MMTSPASGNGNRKRMSELTHKELVDRARRWLHGTLKCSLVITEPRYHALTEQPDAIGWAPEMEIPFPSYIVEVKTCLSDFYSDRAKPGRRDPTKGMGQYRYYLTAKGLLKKDMIPDGWGLAEVCRSVVRIRRHAVRRKSGQYNQLEEHGLLLKHCERAGVNTYREWWRLETQGRAGDGI